MATFVASFTSQFRQSARITGTKANIHLDDFVLASYEKQVSFTVNQSTGKVNAQEGRIGNGSISNHVMYMHVMSCHVVSCHVVSCDAM